MAITDGVKTLLVAFEKENSKYKGKAYLTGADRTWDEQLEFILERPKSYPNIVKSFVARFKLDELPATSDELEKDQLLWWQSEIMKQAGKSPGFPHVGGKAQDVSVKNLDVDGRKLLLAKIETKYSVLMEKVAGADSVYGVAINAANVFHVY